MINLKFLKLKKFRILSINKLFYKIILFNFILKIIKIN